MCVRQMIILAFSSNTSMFGLNEVFFNFSCVLNYSLKGWSVLQCCRGKVHQWPKKTKNSLHHLSMLCPDHENVCDWDVLCVLMHNINVWNFKPAFCLKITNSCQRRNVDVRSVSQWSERDGKQRESLCQCSKPWRHSAELIIITG